MIGQTLSHYRIEGRLGEGGMGEVYSARDLRLDRSVALKVIRADIGDPILRDRFWREARAAAAFTHPALCHVYEIGEDQGGCSSPWSCRRRNAVASARALDAVTDLVPWRARSRSSASGVR